MRLSGTRTIRAGCLGDGAAHRRVAQRAGDRRRSQRSRGSGGVHLHAGRRADPGHRSRSHPGAGPLSGLRGAVGRSGGSARRDRVPRAGGLARPRPAGRSDRVHRDGGSSDGQQRHRGGAHGILASPRGRGTRTGTRAAKTPGPRPGVAGPTVQRRTLGPRTGRGRGRRTRPRRRRRPGRAGSPGRRSGRQRSTSRSSCRVGSTSRARWHRPPGS